MIKIYIYNLLKIINNNNYNYILLYLYYIIFLFLFYFDKKIWNNYI